MKWHEKHCFSCCCWRSTSVIDLTIFQDTWITCRCECVCSFTLLIASQYFIGYFGEKFFVSTQASASNTWNSFIFLLLHIFLSFSACVCPILFTRIALYSYEKEWEKSLSNVFPSLSREISFNMNSFVLVNWFASVRGDHTIESEQIFKSSIFYFSMHNCLREKMSHNEQRVKATADLTIFAPFHLFLFLFLVPVHSHVYICPELCIYKCL